MRRRGGRPSAAATRAVATAARGVATAARRAALAAILLLAALPIAAGSWEASAGISDDTLCERCPEFSLFYRNGAIEMGLLANPNEIIIPFAFRPPCWAAGAVLSLDFRHGWDLYAYASAHYDWVIKESPSLATTLRFELGAKGGMGGSYHRQALLLYYAPHWLLGIRQDMGKVGVEIDFASYDRFRADQLLGPLIHGVLDMEIGSEVEVGAYCSLVFANGLNELACFRAKRGGVLCVIKGF